MPIMSKGDLENVQNATQYEVLIVELVAAFQNATHVRPNQEWCQEESGEVPKISRHSLIQLQSTLLFVLVNEI